MTSVSSTSAREDKAVCVIDGSIASIYCCVCEQYYCDLDNANFHNSNPDFTGHMRLRLRPAPSQASAGPTRTPAPPTPPTAAHKPQQEEVRAPAPPSPQPPQRTHEMKEKDLIEEEVEDDSSKEAKHIGDGIVQGAEAFGKGIIGGITGVVLDPIKGGKEDGAAGALKGAATGIGNVAIKPVRGTGELLSRAAEGLRNTPTAIFSDESERKQHTEIKHVGEGLLVGTKNLGMGLFDGITGVVMEPVKGAQNGGGVQGFFKGVGKGLVGVVCKPVAGAIDFVAKPIEGIANTPGTIADKIEEIHQKKKAEQNDDLYT